MTTRDRTEKLSESNSFCIRWINLRKVSFSINLLKNIFNDFVVVVCPQFFQLANHSAGPPHIICFKNNCPKNKQVEQVAIVINNKIGYLSLYFHKLENIYALMIYTAPCIMFWMRAYQLHGQVERGWALEIASFLGHVKSHRANRRGPFGALNTWGFQGPAPSHLPK